MKSCLLDQAAQLYQENTRIKRAIFSVLEESEAYAADELVELAEEVLNQIAAIGIVQYLKEGRHKEVYNDFLIQLFNSTGQDFNAGPLFRWSANMVRDCPTLVDSAAFQFFWQKEEDSLQLSVRGQHLSELRNQVMHGFFVLPPEKNQQEADAIGQLLIDLHAVSFFDSTANYHFFRDGMFTGKWNITEELEWVNYFDNGVFGALAKRIVLEQGVTFWENELTKFLEGGAPIPNINNLEVFNFISNNNSGALAIWVHPSDVNAEAYFSSLAVELKAIPNTRLVAFGLYEQGISYTGNFLINRLVQLLDPEGITRNKNKKDRELLVAARKLTSDKVIVLINRIHLALFSSQHISQFNDLLYDNDILMVAMGHHFEHFNSYFNSYTKLDYPTSVPTPQQGIAALRNYLRFKGPSHEKDDERFEVDLLEEILLRILQKLTVGDKIYARRFADEHQYNIEYVHEIFSLLHPWVKTSRENFEADSVDELYGFPSSMTEVTSIYLALGRRDLKLEYQHKVISL
jgi:hypothetical protein